jgi:carboxyl-terminal processing protease
MRIRRTILAPVVVALVALATGGWFLQRGAGPERNLYANARLFEEVLRYVADGFVERKEPGELYRMAIDGLLEELGDPHTGLLPAREYENLRIQTSGEYGGLGISIDRRNGWVTVINPLPGTPGERAGLRAGDQILEVDGESARGWTNDQAVARLRGPRGTKVRLKIGRPGVPEPIELEIVRAEIHLKSVPSAYMLDDRVGYVELTQFSESSTREVRDAVRALQAEGAQGVILDMRFNSGGLLDQGVSVSDLFLSPGQAIVETRGRSASQNHRVSAQSRDEFAGLPLVVLVGPQSASATEIVAGALQDHDRALLLGQTTYGKGSVQTVFRLSDNNWLKLTTARWYTPSGRSIQAPYGIDRPVADAGDEEAPAHAVPAGERPEYRTDSGRIVYGGGGITPDLVLLPDTLTAAERPFVQEVYQRQFRTFTEARLNFAVQLLSENPNLRPDFRVTDAMLDGFWTALVQAGARAARADYDAARRWVEREIQREVVISKWGVAEARKRLNADDPQVRTASELLRGASSPQALFAAASEYQRVQKTAATSGRD